MDELSGASRPGSRDQGMVHLRLIADVGELRHEGAYQEQVPAAPQPL